MDQWVTTPPLWTSRSADQWIGDGCATVANPLTAVWSVPEHFASLLAVVDAPVLAVTCTPRPVQTSISATHRAGLLTVTAETPPAELHIHTQLHPATLDVGFYLHAAYGVEMTMARQDILLHAQMRPKNPIILTDVTLLPDALALDFGMPSPVYGGVYEQVDAETLPVSMYHWSAAPEVITTVYPAALSMGTVDTSGPVAVLVDSAVAVDAPISLDIQALLAQPALSVGVAPAVIPVEYAMPQESVVVIGYGMQDDIQMGVNLLSAVAWHDNTVPCEAIPVAFATPPTVVRASPVILPPLLRMSTRAIEPEYAGAHFYEWALLTSPVTTQITLNCPANIREYVYAEPRQ